MQYLTQASEIKQAIATYAQAEILWLDTEIADYKSDRPRLSLIQILTDSTDNIGTRVTILDVLNLPKLADEFIAQIMINPLIEKVFHNAKYDLKFLGEQKAENITCTLELAKKIPYHRLPVSNYQLKTLAEKLGDFPAISKDEQTGDWGKRPLTSKQLHYATMDTVYLAQVHQKLLQLVNPDPAQEDIVALTIRYRQIIEQWKKLDGEIQDLKERIKAAMVAQNCQQTRGFSLSCQKRTTKKVAFNELARVTAATGIDLNLSVTLTKQLQQELAEVMEQLPIESETKTVATLKVKDLDADDIPF